MRFHRKIVQGLILSILCCLSACSSKVQAPVESPADAYKKQGRSDDRTTSSSTAKKAPGLSKNQKQHVVRKGDTLYSIAWNYGYDYREVAKWNGIHAPYTIYPGQKISLVAPTLKRAQQLQTEPVVKSGQSPQVPENTVEQSVTEKKIPAKTRNTVVSSGPLNWTWPTKGSLIRADTPISKKGIDISGLVGQQINAAAPGEVVYSGSGLLGYGRLIIIKHDDTFLSAYAHNKELLVKEGQRVSAGEQIALMGQTNNGRTILHFEIRKNGQPVDPLTYLPKI